MSLWSAIGSVVGSIAGPLLNTASSAITSHINSKEAYNYQVKLDKQNFQYNKDLQKYAYGLNQQGITNAPSLLRKGYEKANLNPILAYQNTNAPSVNATGFSSSPGGALATNAQANAIAQQQANAQINFTNAQAQLSKEQAKTEMYKRDNFEADSLLKYAQSIKTDKEASWIDRERASQIEAMIMSAKAQQVASNASMINAETTRDITNFDKNRYMRWMRNHKNQESFTYGLGQWTGALGKLFSGSANLSSSHKR